MNIDKTIIIDGGLGRNICAIPALEKYVEQNPNTLIVSHFWTPIYFGNKKLQKNVFDSDTKGLFERIKNSQIIHPEPYYNTDFINERIHLIDGFCQELNVENNEKPKLYFSNSERSRVERQTKAKLIVVQPFGSTSKFDSGDCIDDTVRSLNIQNTLMLLNRLKKEGHKVIIFDNRDFPFLDKNDFPSLVNMHIRDSAAIISCCDYFVGIDSSGQHIAYATEKPGTTIFGGTSYQNFGYKDWFSIITKEEYDEKEYMPIRLTHFDYQIAGLTNDNLMDFTEDEMEEICESIIVDIKEKT